MERGSLKIIDINNHKNVPLKVCSKCGCRLLVQKDNDQLTVFDSKIITAVRKISEKVTIFTDTTHVKREFPVIDCYNLCATKVFANRVLENLTRNDPSSVVYLKDLSEKIRTCKFDVDRNLRNNHEYCYLCGFISTATFHIVDHLILYHPECLALVKFLRCRPLSELNIAKDVCILQPSVKIEVLPSHIYKECITRGYACLKPNTGVISLLDAEPNSQLNAFSEIVQNSKEISAEMNRKTIITSPNQDTKDTTALLLQKKKFKTFTKNYNFSKRNVSLCYKNDIIPTTRILYGVEDLARDNLKKQQEKEKMAKKEKILKKMLAKYHEKETKKEVLYCQKRLSRYVSQHRNFLFLLEHKLNNARQSNAQSREELLEEVNYVMNDKVKKAVTYLLKELFEAMTKVPQ